MRPSYYMPPSHSRPVTPSAHAEDMHITHLEQGIAQGKARREELLAQAQHYQEQARTLDQEIAFLRTEVESHSEAALTYQSKMAESQETKTQLIKEAADLETEEATATESLQAYEARYLQRKQDKEAKVEEAAVTQRAWNGALAVVQTKAREILQTPVAPPQLAARKAAAVDRAAALEHQLHAKAQAIAAARQAVADAQAALQEAREEGDHGMVDKNRELVDLQGRMATLRAEIAAGGGGGQAE